MTDYDGVAENDTQLTQWNTAKMTGTWDASALSAITAGTSFTVGLPDVFKFRQYPRTDAMTVRDDGGVERTIGECVTQERSMTCTFNDEAQRLSEAGFKNFKGSYSLLMTAVQSTSEETAIFNLNGELRPIDLPGTGGITPEQYNPAQLSKWTRDTIAVGQTSNTWVVYYGTDYMRDNVKPAGTIKTDGSVSTLVLHEVLTPGQEFDWSRAGDVRLALNRSAANSQLFQVLWTMDGATSNPDWKVEVIKNAPNDVTFKITGPFPASTNMNLDLPVKFTEPAKPGVKYSNTVSAEGLDSSTTVSAYYVDSVEITVTMEPGYGTFKVSKLVDGSGAALLDSSVQFPLKVDFTLPAHYNTYNPVWQPPDGFTMDADGLTGHGTIMIAPGKTTYFDSQVTLPAGTKVTLSEDPDGARPIAPPTVEWGTPVISQPTFEIGDQRVTSVQITNTANYVPPKTGTFQVVKVVDGDYTAASDETFTVGYRCDDANTTTGQVTVRADGTPENGPTVPAGTTCTITEDTDQAERDGYSRVTTYSATSVTVAADTTPTVTVTNTYTRNTGSFTVAKVVAGDYTATATDTFTVGYECNDPAATKGELTVPADGTAVSGPTVPVGTSCTLKEDTAAAGRPGYSLATTYSATSVTIAQGATPAVTVTNTYTALKGSFMIAKTVDGDGAELAAETEFTFDYTCKPATGAAAVTDSVTVKGGKSVAVEGVPVGDCVVTERDATVAGTSVSTALSVDGTPVGGNEAMFSVTDGTTVSVAATNTYTRDRGSFSVAKTVVGGQESFQQDTFVFDYTCTDGTMGHLDVPGDGTAVTSPMIPAGTECTVSERAESADRVGYTVESEIPGGGKVTIAKDTVAPLTATNTYSPVPTPSPSVTTPGKPPLAKTGASNVVLLGVIGTVLVAGGGLAFLAKRRRDDA
ncbi:MULTISPECIES: DUF5979 domain-containing protein [Actinomyces]|uniref:LPXTG cell wall anchor domain-containing protein n=1 Tax=Actinomyces respiraculi TaxID=2744574 RepID=A0A7T0PXI5_9ACTO|nr:MULTISPECIES: DUF5979 domain-containing protein [Actinomyces]QPL05665.1 LPXTG cell wall anchor domain-containing protein [Actinomyces respiraculi]